MPAPGLPLFSPNHHLGFLGAQHGLSAIMNEQVTRQTEQGNSDPSMSVASEKPHGAGTAYPERSHVVHPPSVLQVTDYSFSVKVPKTKETKLLIDGVSLTAKSGHLTGERGACRDGQSVD